MKKDIDKQLCDAVMSKANGCEAREVIEEYALDEQTENIKLVKKKITTKYLPPDISAVKMYLGMTQLGSELYDQMTDDELLAEKNRLLNILKNMEEGDGDYKDDTQNSL